MAALNCSQMHKASHLLSLPYPSLIQQLIHMHKSHESHPFKTLLSLSANHDCHHLFRIYCSKPQKNKMDLWEKVTKQGLMEMFGIQDHQRSGMNVPELNSQYFKQLQQSKLLPLKQNSSLDLAQSLFFSLPQIYPLRASTPQQLKALRENYTYATSLLLPLLSPTSPTILNFPKMFPPQLFNVTNQPLVKDVYKKHISQRLSYQTIGDFCGSLDFIGRMGLQGGWFMAGGFEKISKMIKDGSMRSSLGDWMEIANCLFLGLRKCGIEKTLVAVKPAEIKEREREEYYSKSMKQKIMSLLHQIFQEIPITKQIRQKTITTQNDANNFVRELRARMEAQLRQKQSSTERLIKELYDVTESTREKEKPSDLDSHIKIKICLQIFRYFATLFHLELSHSNLPQIPNQSVQVFFNCKQMGETLKQIIYYGDTLAEIEYLRNLYEYVRGERLFKSKIDEQITKVRNDMRTYIDHLQNGNLVEIGYGVLKRADNIEYLLTGLTRLKFRKNAAYEKGNQKEILTKCLLNDRQFLSHYGSRSFKSLISSNLNSIHTNVVESKESKYPYFPSFLSSSNENKKTQIYVKDNFCKHSRIDYQDEHEMIDCTQVAKVSEKIEEFKKKSKLFL